MDGLRKRFEKYKYPLLVLIVGAVLMLLPSGGSTKEQPTPDESLAQLLESVEGVGELRVVISETGERTMRGYGWILLTRYAHILVLVPIK